MTDYVITNGRSSDYPARHYGAHFTGSRATFCLDADFAGLAANVLAIPNLPVSVLSTSPVVVGEEFFGMSINQRANDSLTGVTAKTVRSHDCSEGIGRWQMIEPSDGVYSWTSLDSWVNTHYAAGREIIFTLFGTPAWASARPTEENAYSAFSGGVWYNRGISAEPTNMAQWSAFCTAVATRYLGKIKYYEVWNEPNFQNNGTTTTGVDFFFSGTFAKLSEMTRRANQAIKAVDPTAKIICPATTTWSATPGQSAETYFTGMMAASDGAAGAMKDWVDIIGVHLYLPANKVQDLAGIIDRINAAKTAAGVSGLETWDTESAPIGPDVSGLSDDQARVIIARSMLTMAAKGVARTIYYQWDHGDMGIINRPGIISNLASLRTLLMSGTMLNASRFTDGRFAYWTTAGVVIV